MPLKQVWKHIGQKYDYQSTSSHGWFQVNGMTIETVR